MKLLNGTVAISVIVPCRGHAKELRRCLEGITRQSLAATYETIVVDSAADSAVANVVAMFQSVRIVRDRTGLLPGGARNLGASYADGEFLAFIDADCVPESGWLAAAAAVLRSGSVAAGGPILDYLPYHPIAAADNLLQFPCLSRHRPDGVTSHFPGCNFAITRDAFQELGGFVADLSAGEDVLFVDAAAKRWPGHLRFVRNMKVRHAGRTTLNGFWLHHERFGFYRGKLGLRLNPVYQRLGCRVIFALLIACGRLGYIVIQVAKRDPVGLLRALLLMPILLVGLVAWGKGFHHGCREAMTENG